MLIAAATWMEVKLLDDEMVFSTAKYAQFQTIQNLRTLGMEYSIGINQLEINTFRTP